MKQYILALLLVIGCASGSAVAGEDPYERGLAAYNAGNYSLAHDLILPLAEHGHPAANNLLGMMYELGKGVSLDTARAVTYYRKGAKLGDVYAQFNLAASYNTGVGVPMNYRSAVKWYRRAAEQGASFAQYSLATMYEDGSGVDRDFSQAAYWYQQAAENGSMQAQNNLGWMYERGQGVKKSLVTAYAWLDTAVSQGLDSAVEERQRVARQLTKDELAKAKRLAEKFRQAYSEKKSAE